MSSPLFPPDHPITLAMVQGKVPGRFIGPGELYASKRPCLITTVLGSCVAVCLFDPIAGIGGMNHFVLPFLPSGHPPSARQGDFAIATLIRRMVSQGADPTRMQAKIFGGSVLMIRDQEKDGRSSSIGIGAQNVALTRTLLAAQGIPITREKVLETAGMVVKMLTSTGDVWLRQLSSSPPIAPKPPAAFTAPQPRPPPPPPMPRRQGAR